MILLTLLNPKRTLQVGVVLMWATIGLVLPGQAQQTDANPAVLAINLPVHLRLGATTVGKFAAEIGGQIGQTIETDPALSEHRILVQMDGISAEKALQTLAELNGWEITHPRSGHYRIRRIPVLKAKGITDLPAAFRMALPMDFLRYLGLEATQEDQSHHPAIQRQYNDARQDHLKAMENQNQITLLHNQLLDTSTVGLIQALPTPLRDGRKHAYTTLSAEQRDNLLTLLIIKKLDLLNVDMLQGKLKPFQKDWNTAELTLKGGKMLMIGSTTHLNGGQLHEAFGAPIQALQTPTSKP